MGIDGSLSLDVGLAQGIFTIRYNASEAKSLTLTPTLSHWEMGIAQGKSSAHTM